MLLSVHLHLKKGHSISLHMMSYHGLTHNKDFEWTSYQNFDVVIDYHLASSRPMVITHNKTFEWTCY
jgi:hypothetical protein